MSISVDTSIASKTDLVLWLNQNTHRKFPFALDATLQEENSSFSVPSSLLVDLLISITPTKDDLAQTPSDQRIFLSSIVDNGTSFYMVFSYNGIVDGQLTPFEFLISADISKDIKLGNTIAERTVLLSPIVDSIPSQYESLRYSTGLLLLGTVEDLLAGTHALTYAAGKVLSTRVVQGALGLSKLVVYTENTETDLSASSTTVTEPMLLTGTVNLVAGSGIKFEYDSTTGNLTISRLSQTSSGSQDFQTIVTEIVQEIKEQLGDAIKTINGIKPDSTGNFTVAGTGAVAVLASGLHGVKILDTAATPCCNSLSLIAEITTSVEALNTTVNTVFEQLQTISNNIEELLVRMAYLITESR